MKTLITTILVFTVLAGYSQTTKTSDLSTTKPVKLGGSMIAPAIVIDTTHYRFTEPEVSIMMQLINAGDQAVSSSDNFSRNQWRSYHQMALHIDSLITKQYNEKHPKKEQVKKEKP